MNFGKSQGKGSAITCCMVTCFIIVLSGLACRSEAQGARLSSQFSDLICISLMLNKNTLGVKKVRGQSKAALQIGMCDQNFDVS